jgi:hypothetical protein
MFGNKPSRSMLDAVNKVLLEEPKDKKRMITDAEMDETGFHKAAHAAKRANQTHFEFQGKKYPVTAKSHKEGVYSYDVERAFPNGKASGVKSHPALVKTNKPIGTKVSDIGKGGKEHNVKTDKEWNKQKGVSEGYVDDIVAKARASGMNAKVVTKADKERDLQAVIDRQKKAKEKAASNSPSDSMIGKGRDSFGPNRGYGQGRYMGDSVEVGSFAQRLLEREMTSGEKKKREKIVMSMKDKSDYFKKKYGKNWKNVMYATATKNAMGEEVEELDETTGVTDYNPKSQGGTRKELLTMYAKSGDPKHAEAARKAGATQSELKAASMKKEEYEIEEAADSHEEVGQIDELSKKTLSSYIDKAKDRYVKHASSTGLGGSDEKRDSDNKKSIKYAQNMLKAKNKMEEVEIDEGMMDTMKKVGSKVLKTLGHGDDKEMRKDLQRKMGMKPTGKKPMKKEEYEYMMEKNESHTHAAHYEDPKTGEWTGMNLLVAKDDEDAVRQAHEKCKEGCRLSRVERHVPVKEEYEELDEAEYSTDMLRGRVNDTGMANDFKSFKVKLKGDIGMMPPEKEASKFSTRARASIVPHDPKTDVELDPRYGHPMPQNYTHTEAAESPFTSYKDKTKPSIFAPKSHTAKKTEKGVMYTKNWSKKDQEPEDEKKK